MPTIITADKSYKLSELAEAVANADDDLIYIVKQVAGEDVSYAMTRQQFLAGVGGTLSVEDGGAPVGTASTLNFIEGSNVTLTITDQGGGQIDVEIASSGSAGGAAWGSITGTLADQTDLQNALNGKVSTTGNESIDGIKTFTSFSITPSSAPTTDYQVANKKYVDDEIAAIDSVTGPGSSTDNAITRWDGTGGDTVQDSGVTIDDSDNVSGANEVEAASYSNANVVTLTDTSGLDFSLADSNFFQYTLTANETLNLPTDLRVCNFQIKFIQDGTGSRTLSFNAAYLFPGGTAPTLSTDPNAVDIITGFCDGTNIYIVSQLDFQTA